MIPSFTTFIPVNAVVGGDSSPVTIAVTATLSVLVVLLIILAAVIIKEVNKTIIDWQMIEFVFYSKFASVRRREKKKPLTTDYEISGATNNSYIKDVNEPEGFSKNAEETEEEDEALYTNLEKPVSILIADLEKYMRDCESSNSRKLEQQFKLLNGDRQFASHVGDKEQNKTKNRFKNMIAYDHSRVVLDIIDGDPDSDYYNANYVKNIESEVAFIASQGPNKASVGDFWRMVWRENVCNIVMLTNLIEDGKDRCIQYWPPTVGATKRFGEIKLQLESDEQFGDYNIRELQVKLGENVRTVTNWHFKTWPDKDVPDQPSPLIEFARRIKTYQKTAPGHLLVHCSAGVGRTGTFIALYTLMDVIETDTKIDIYGYVERMRQDRIKMVQTEIQYKFLHECMLEIFLTGNTKIPVKNMESFDLQAEKENLKRQFKVLAKLDKRSTSPHAATPEESEKSRYPKIVPVDKRRPFLQTPGKTSNSNYINACFVTSYRKKDAFIATQSPLPNTVEDFWRLVYDWKCPLIVMLNQLDPRDKTCCKYWPENVSSRFGNMTVMLKEEKNVGIYVQRQFELIDAFNQEPRFVHHMQLNSWDERNQQDLTILIHDMEKIQQDYSMVAPAVIHCMMSTIFAINY
ncbi:Receptor-type tyrosine-protein phosphatase T [Holothuria leucospilota]|uniref:protein-tyrosine-phosphatase n=1 Tax=Holothuria leucospilota TaxID=206669 RepID=A0A9Q1CA61_HOLLE|nr:Receptor-type tyrosine-protein phosphatase T [Holothuria leucospilota]